MRTRVRVEAESKGGSSAPKTHFKIQLRAVLLYTASLVLFSNLRVYFKNKAFFSHRSSEVSHVCEKITWVLEIYFGSLRLSVNF